MGKTKRSGGETPEKQASHLRLNDYPNPWGVVDIVRDKTGAKLKETL